jgi:hypothetical protein
LGAFGDSYPQGDLYNRGKTRELHYWKELSMAQSEIISLDEVQSNLDPYRIEVEALIKNGSTQRFVARWHRTTETNLHHFLKQSG